ncbi:3-oxoacyl-[acyl-carrier-protein] synthase III C-terminal domain-containing protein [Bdellovibrionota bacterium FG-1]
MSLAGVASFLPETIIENEFFGEAIKTTKQKMFLGVQRRRHVQRNETAASMIHQASSKLIEKLNLDPEKDIDILLTNVSLPDEPFLGCGPSVSHLLNTRARWVIDVHSAGCVSFIYMMDLARALMTAYGAKSALICNVQNAAGQIFSQPQIRKKPQAAVPGDGCGVGYFTASNENPVLSLVHHCFGANAKDMFSTNDEHRKYFEPGVSEGYIDFNEAKIASITSRGNRLVPDVIQEACQLAQMKTSQIDALVTNQPNPYFLRNWREALELPPEKHFDTFSEYGNLFGAGIPITLEQAIQNGKLKTGSNLVLGGFSHAGDFAAATVIRWNQSRG